ncbi:MAG: hypothetical protein KIT80_16630 [Chitinophagaceae bacterium]|nr:hypothetical protein [Chitinophagaceae bacterium]MCW5928545.1 hypothetical protein [Chitinophagaceae bacterium]
MAQYAKKYFGSDIGILITVFVISRVIIHLLGLELAYDALFKYWQYLDVETLKYNLLKGVWYNHAQPPVFNIFLGTILKLSGSYSFEAFSVVFKAITLVNTVLLHRLCLKITKDRQVTLFVALLYLLSPATMVYENELFYTTFVGLLFLIACYFLLEFRIAITWRAVSGFFLALMLIALTRSMYHLVWLIVVGAVIFFYHRKRTGSVKIIIVGLIAVCFTACWYIKNYMIFEEFSTSSWVGMNTSRNIFHDNEVTDTTRIESIPPFSHISAYAKFLPPGYEAKYRGLNDRDLLSELKNDSLMNVNHVGYIYVSKQYLQAGKEHIKKHPFSYVQNVIQSAIIFFTPGTRYSVTEFQSRKIKYYDVVYSFNLSHFATNKQERRIALTVSAIPKFLIYVLVFFTIGRYCYRNRELSAVNLFILLVFGYVLTLSSLLEHYENMRFRFEIEPLFLLLLAQALVLLRKQKVGNNKQGNNHII